MELRTTFFNRNIIRSNLFLFYYDLKCYHLSKLFFIWDLYLTIFQKSFKIVYKIKPDRKQSN